MFYSRCRAVLPRASAARVPFPRAPRWSQVRQLRVPRSPKPSSPPPEDPQHQTSLPPEFPGEFGEGPQYSNVRIRQLVPAIWALTVSTGLFFSFAYFTAKSEMETKSPLQMLESHFRPSRTSSYPTYASTGPPTPTEVVTRAWRDTDPMKKLSLGLIGVNGAVHLSQFVALRAWTHLWHIPYTNRNYTLFTSTFVHGGLGHFGFNMYAMYNFLPATGYSRLFRGDTNHMLAFFLSTGVLSGFAQHFAGSLFRGSLPMASGGASGALFAVFGAFCMQYPTQGVGLVFIPWYIEAQFFLPLVMAFDLYGMVRGYSFMNLGHAAHLGGASLGIAYSSLDGHNRVWRPLVDFWKRRLRAK